MASELISTALHSAATAARVSADQARAVISLTADGATVPFIARYRQERTGGLDETSVRRIQREYRRVAELEDRRRTILASLQTRGHTAPRLLAAVAAAERRSELEDLYAPYRPRSATRADRARSDGWGDLAAALGPAAAPTDRTAPLAAVVERHTDPDTDRTAALRGAADILAADMAADPEVRRTVYDLFLRQGALTAARARGVSQADAAAYREYLDWKEPARRAPSHRVLAVLRGERDGILRVTARPPAAGVMRILERWFPPPVGSDRRQFQRGVAEDAWKRLLCPALETRFKRELRERAETAATEVFAANLRDLLLAPPLGAVPMLAIDPGFRSGCKVVALAATGAVCEHESIFPHPPQRDTAAAAERIRQLVERHHPEVIAVGNGTAGRETEEFLAATTTVPVVRVSESGASVYSASVLARDELPELTVAYRGAVSIGRRLQDPLAELVKVDPASVGVGQYQHDLDPGRLSEAVDAVVESCVNTVGADVNTAGTALLSRVSGLDRRTAAAIVAHREEHGTFQSREEIRGVSGVGESRWEQAAGFLRCAASPDRRDHTAIHPERYALVARMAEHVGCSVAELVGNPAEVDALDPTDWIDPASGLGEATVVQVIGELRQPGRDVRGRFEPPVFDAAVRSIDDLRPGMVLDGSVTNVTAFGAFVDIGVHRDGLVHVSRLADRRVAEPRDVVRVGQTVRVAVVEIDRDRGRISLSMRVSETG